MLEDGNIIRIETGATLQTKWPTVLANSTIGAVASGIIFSAYRNKEAPCVYGGLELSRRQNTEIY